MVEKLFFSIGLCIEKGTKLDMNVKKRFMFIASILFMLLILIILIALLAGKNKLINNKENIKAEELVEDGVKFEIYSKSIDTIELRVLVTVTDNEYGVNSIKLPNSKIIIGNGKKQIAIDYKITEDGIYNFEYTNQNGDVIQKQLSVDENFRNNILKFNFDNVDSLTTDITANIEYNSVKNGDVYYKLGENNDWKKYEDNDIKLNSYELLKYKNSDNTITLYAKIQDKNKNEILTKKILSNLDLDMPNEPVITSDKEYPVISSKGVGVFGHIIVDFEDRDDVTNYYSYNNTDWEEYTNEIPLNGFAKIYAKTVKKESGLQISTSKLVGANAADALSPLVYDKDYESYASASGRKRINVEKEVWGSALRIKWKRAGYDFAGDGSNSAYLYAYDASGKVIGNSFFGGQYEIPENTEYIMFCGTGVGKIYEVSLYQLAKNIINVSKDGDDYNGDGTEEKPYASLKKAIELAGYKQKIYVSDGVYNLDAMNEGFSPEVGIFDGDNAVEIYGNNENTILIYDATNVSVIDASVIYFKNTESIVRNLTYVYKPKKGFNYQKSIFYYSLGNIENVFFRVIGNNMASYLYYNSQPSRNKVINCTFFHDLKSVDSSYSGTTNFTNIATNVMTRTSGTNTNVIVKAFGEPEDSIEDLIEKSKNDNDFNTNQAGVFYGEHAWDK